MFSLLSVDSASGAFATSDEGAVMDTGGKERSTINIDLVHVECSVGNKCFLFNVPPNETFKCH